MRRAIADHDFWRGLALIDCALIPSVTRDTKQFAAGFGNLFATDVEQARIKLHTLTVIRCTRSTSQYDAAGSVRTVASRISWTEDGDYGYSQRGS
jgi:hypothetical protein